MTNANLEAIDASKASTKEQIFSQFLAQIEAVVNASNEGIDGLALDYLTEDDRNMFRTLLKGKIQTVQLNASSALTL